MAGADQDATRRGDEEFDAPPSGDSRGPLHTPRSFESLGAEAKRLTGRARDFNEKVNERSGRNLAIAVAIGIGLIGAVLASLLFDKRWFILFGVAMVALLVVELSTAMRVGGMRVPRVPSTIAALVVVPVAFVYGAAWLWGSLLIGTVFVLLWRCVQMLFESPRPTGRQLAEDAACIIFVQLYTTFLGAFTALLVAQPRGELWALVFIVVVVCVDTGAYATGLRFGRTKLAPRVSPGKTWEGTLGGTALAILAAVLLGHFLLGLPWWFGFVMGPALTITATAGDLTESMIKRSLGVKDMSNWLPGHGGFFDRLDSILPSGAMAFALYFWAAPLM